MAARTKSEPIAFSPGITQGQEKSRKGHPPSMTAGKTTSAKFLLAIVVACFLAVLSPVAAFPQAVPLDSGPG